MSVYQNLFLVLILIIAGGFYSLAEIVLAASRRFKLRQMAADGEPRALQIIAMQEKPGEYFTVVQIGQNALAILGGIVCEGAFSPLLINFLSRWLSISNATSIGTVLSFIFVVTLFIILSDLVPKRLAMVEPERLALWAYKPMRISMTVLRPIVCLYSIVSNAIFRLLRLPMLRDERVTSEDILAMAEAGTQAGVLKQNEQRVIANLVEMNDRLVASAMTSRDRVAYFIRDDMDSQIRTRIAAEPYTIYPVCDRDIDHVIGYVKAKDLFQRALNNQPIDLTDEALIQKVLVLPDRLSLTETLAQFRQAREDFAIVVNEYSLVVGLVTLNDVMSTIMGDLIGPGQGDEELVVQRDADSWLIDGITPIEDVERVLNLQEDLPQSDEYDTLAGFLMVMLRRVPSRTDTVEWGGYLFEVIDVDSYRIDQVLVTRIKVNASDKQLLQNEKAPKTVQKNQNTNAD